LVLWLSVGNVALELDIGRKRLRFLGEEGGTLDREKKNRLKSHVCAFPVSNWTASAFSASMLNMIQDARHGRRQIWLDCQKVPPGIPFSDVNRSQALLHKKMAA
jgi:hypothetical protein